MALGSYHDMVAALLEAEAAHDALEADLFARADDEICAELASARAEDLGALREVRRQLVSLHARWRIRRAALVGSDPELLAGALWTA